VLSLTPRRFFLIDCGSLMLRRPRTSRRNFPDPSGPLDQLQPLNWVRHCRVDAGPNEVLVTLKFPIINPGPAYLLTVDAGFWDEAAQFFDGVHMHPDVENTVVFSTKDVIWESPVHGRFINNVAFFGAPAVVVVVPIGSNNVTSRGARIQPWPIQVPSADPD
jgi:hypothetical protein